MTEDGVKSALAVVLSSYSSYSGCRQYRENIADARTVAGESAPRIDKLRVWYNHPDFIAANADHLAEALAAMPAEARAQTHVAFTAHSIPEAMANTSDYEKQLREACRLVAETLQIPDTRWQLVYQSRSGRPQDPWLEPDINLHLKHLKRSGVDAAVVMPIGFLSDHMEVIFDLDQEARATANDIQLNMVRAKTVGVHPRFVAMLRELIVERMNGRLGRSVGQYGPNHDICPLNCCLPPQRAAPTEKRSIESGSPSAESAGR
jgi:ferrochelatase